VTFWTLLTALSIAAVIYNLEAVTSKFLSYPVVVGIEVQHANDLDFPAVTICNVSPMRSSLYDKSTVVSPSITAIHITVHHDLSRSPTIHITVTMVALYLSVHHGVETSSSSQSYKWSYRWPYRTHFSSMEQMLMLISCFEMMCKSQWVSEWVLNLIVTMSFCYEH